VITIGITGSFGTGKTTVAEYFKALGAKVLDADKIAHETLLKKVTGHKSPVTCYKKIVKIFGKKILKKNKEIDRKKLGKIVFRDRTLLKKLNSIIHPYVIKKIKKGIEEIKMENSKAMIVLDIPLLVETGLLGLVDKLVVVNASRNAQIDRCRKKTGLARTEILARITAQAPLKRKVRISDFVIDNNGTEKQTKREVEKVWERMQPQTARKKRI